jgi:prepilin-type N-terminal cleavage/methylation domain-containing protein
MKSPTYNSNHYGSEAGNFAEYCSLQSEVSRMRGGFTLLELLITVAVIAVLTALLLPALARAKDKSKALQCISNQRQWGLAMRMYADDFDDYLPRRGQGVQTLALINRPSDWFNALPPYFNKPPYEDLMADGKRPTAGAHDVFVCPDTTDPGGLYFLPYGMNMNLSTWNLPEPTKFSAVIQPDLAVAIGEGPGPYASTYPSIQAYSIVARHAGRINLLFLGGEVLAFAGTYVGCSVGDPGRPDVRWLTGTPSDAQAKNY